MIFAQMLAIGSGILALDQGSKFLMAEWLGRGASQHRVDVIGSWVGFEYVENTGAAFGMLSGRPWLVSILAVVVAVMFVTVFRQVLPTDAGVRWCVALILAGAIGNMIDRARIGYVGPWRLATVQHRRLLDYGGARAHDCVGIRNCP
jgi:signal peptidase II